MWYMSKIHINVIPENPFTMTGNLLRDVNGGYSTICRTDSINPYLIQPTNRPLVTPSEGYYAIEQYRFYMVKKPNRLKKFFAKLFLGFEWKNN